MLSPSGLTHSCLGSNLIRKIWVEIFGQPCSCLQKFYEDVWIDPFQSSIAFHVETNRLIYYANHMTGFHMECNTGLKWVNPCFYLYFVEISRIRP